MTTAYLWVMLLLIAAQLVIDVVTPSNRPIVYSETRMRASMSARAALLVWTLALLLG